MLCIGRKDGERVCIKSPNGDEIWIAAHCAGSHLRMRFDAPPTYKILRAELLERPRSYGPDFHGPEVTG